MAQEAELFITTWIRQPETEETQRMEHSFPAVVYEKNDGCFILYEETDPDDSGKTACRIRLSGDGMTITRNGQINSRMELADGKDASVEYRTSCGLLRMDVHTDFLQISRMPGGWEIEAKYALAAQGQPVSSNALRMKVNLKKGVTGE